MAVVTYTGTVRVYTLDAPTTPSSSTIVGASKPYTLEAPKGFEGVYRDIGGVVKLVNVWHVVSGTAHRIAGP